MTVCTLVIKVYIHTYIHIKSIQYRDNLYKKLKMTDPTSINFANIKINLSTYNNILKSNIRLQKQLIIKKYLPIIKMTLDQLGKP